MLGLNTNQLEAIQNWQHNNVIKQCGCIENSMIQINNVGVELTLEVTYDIEFNQYIRRSFSVYVTPDGKLRSEILDTNIYTRRERTALNV